MTHHQLGDALRLLLQGRVGREPTEGGGECSAGDHGGHGGRTGYVCVCVRGLFVVRDGVSSRNSGANAEALRLLGGVGGGCLVGDAVDVNATTDELIVPKLCPAL